MEMCAKEKEIITVILIDVKCIEKVYGKSQLRHESRNKFKFSRLFILLVAVIAL